MRKIGFSLEVEDDWPPYDVEHLWAEDHPHGYRIANVPFFVKGVALGDVISGSVDKDGYIRDWRVVEPSANSTVWIMELSATDVGGRLERLGCDFERADPFNLIAVNVGPSVGESTFFETFVDLEDRSAIEIAVPANRFAQT